MKIAAPAPLIYFVPTVIACFLHFYLPFSLFFSGIWLWAVAAFLFLSSGLLVLWSFYLMFKAKTSPNPYIETTCLLIQGPFNYSRNPMYLSMTGFYLSLAFFLNSFWLFLFFPPLTLLMWWGVILREESYLEERFGQPYLDYKKQVRRWL